MISVRLSRDKWVHKPYSPQNPPINGTAIKFKANSCRKTWLKCAQNFYRIRLTIKMELKIMTVKIIMKMKLISCSNKQWPRKWARLSSPDSSHKTFRTIWFDSSKSLLNRCYPKTESHRNWSQRIKLSILLRRASGRRRKQTKMIIIKSSKFWSSHSNPVLTESSGTRTNGSRSNWKAHCFHCLKVWHTKSPKHIIQCSNKHKHNYHLWPISLTLRLQYKKRRKKETLELNLNSRPR